MTRWIVVVALVLLTLPVRASAHGGGAGGSSSWSLLFVPAMVVLAVGVGMASRAGRGTRVGGLTLIAVGLLVAVVGLVLPGITRGQTVHGHVLIVEPANGSEVEAGRPVKVEARVDAPLASSATDRTGGHLHLYVDGRLRQMPYSTEAEVILEPGRHEIRVEYVDNRHVSFDPPSEDAVTVRARAAGQ